MTGACSMQSDHTRPVGSADGLRVVFAGGGSGGHLYPTLSIADALRRSGSDVSVRFFCTHRAIDRRVLDAAGWAAIVQPVLPFPSRIGCVIPFWRAWRRSVRYCRAEFAVRRPDVVIGSGGFASGPAVVVAARMGIPTAVLNPDAQPGRANRFLARRVQLVLAQWPESWEHFPAGSVVRVVGCPIRRQFAVADRARGIVRFGLDRACRTLLVTGASQGSHSVNRAMMLLAERIGRLRQWQVLHLTGGDDRTAVQTAYTNAGVRHVCRAYTDEMADALAASDLVISRAGASTLAEITAVGRASILLPYPYDRHQHQVLNAKVLGVAGAARVCGLLTDAERIADVLGEQIVALTRDDAMRDAMARRCRDMGKPDAATRAVMEINALVEQRRKAVA